MGTRRFASAFILSAMFYSAGTVYATVYAADESFSVSRILVDKTAETAAEARSLGIAEGQVQAWRKLIERIAVGGDVARLLALGGKEIAPLLEGFEVERETSSPVRYLGTLTYRFRPAAVRGLLRQAHSEEVRGSPKPMVLLPLFREGGKAVLWEGANPWRQRIAGRSWNSGLVPLVVPIGDEADAAVIDSASAYEATPLKLDPLLRRYDAFDGVVAEFTAATDGGSLTLRRSGQAIFSERFTQTVGEGQDSYFDRVMTAMLAALEDQWRKERIAQVVSAQEILTASVPLRSLGDWIEVEKRLEAVPGVRAARLKSLSISEAIIELPFTVSLDQATKNLAQRELRLSRGEEGYELRFTGSAFFGAPGAPKAP